MWSAVDISRSCTRLLMLKFIRSMLQAFSSSKRYVLNFVTPFTIPSVSRTMFEYADCVGVSVFDANATGSLSCRRHPNLSVMRLLPVQFPSVDCSTTYMIIAADTSLQIVIRTLVIFVPHEWNVFLEEFSQRRYPVCEMRYVCRQIVNHTDEPLQIFLVLCGRHLAYVFYFARVWPDSIRAMQTRRIRSCWS